MIKTDCRFQISVIVIQEALEYYKRKKERITKK
jgi:hypothetical protein